MLPFFAASGSMIASHLGEQRQISTVFENTSILPASIFDRSRMSLIRPSRCRPALSIFLQVGDEFVLPVIGRLFLQHLAVADDGVERRAQLVAHVGEELRLVLARLLELPALVLDFVEQVDIGDGDHRLSAKVVIRSICCCVNGSTSDRVNSTAPIADPHA